MIGGAYLDVRPRWKRQRSKPLDREILYLLAQQTSQAVALFAHDLTPIFLNPAMQKLIDLPRHILPFAEIEARLQSAHDAVPVAEVLNRHGEWSGEIVLSCGDPQWSVTLDGRVVLVRADGRPAAYALIARRRCTRVPASIAVALTQRETDVLNALMQGCTSKAIAQRLGISHRTVEAHRSRIMYKLDAQSLPDLFQRIIAADNA